jgi:hypothetical protein
MNTQHTPGPWEKEGATILQGITKKEICKMSGKNEEIQNANARLIAAAPELLSACQAFLELFQSGKNSERRNPYSRPEIKAAIAAITKAKGGAA